MIASTITISRKLVPQRGCTGENLLDVVGRQLEPGLQRMDRLVLGAVVLEDTPQLLDARDHRICK